MKRSHFSSRLVAVLLALVCLAGLLPTAALAAGTGAPATITLADYTVNGMGFNSANLGSCRFHRIDFNVSGKIKTAFCAEHGMSMAAALAGHSWGRPQSVTNPTITTLMAYYYAHTSGDFTDQARAMALDEVWDEERTWMMNAWVQAAVWRFKAGTLANPVTACAEELIPIYNRLKGTSCTSIDESMDRSMGEYTFRNFTQLVLSLGEQGVWGECKVYEYDYTDAGTHEYWADYVQSVMVGELTVTHEQYSLVVKKVDATNPSLTLPGARFRVASQDGAFSREFLTGQDGSFTVDSLAAGTYTVTELEAPEGYQISQAVQYVTLPGTERTVTVTFEDTPVITGTGSIRKVDADNPARGLAGAVIRIEGVDNDFVGTYVTGAGGYLADVPWETMPLGSYTATEVTPPAGYTLSSNTDKVKQSFRWDGRSDVSLVFENDARVKVQLIKLDDSGRPLPGAVFNIIKDGQIIGTEATKADGTITVTDVTEGLYAFVEVSAPAPYACLTQPVIVHVDQADINGGGTVTVTAVDSKLPSLRVVKYDRQSGQPMSGVIFEIFRDTVSLGRFQTDRNGEIILSHVERGTYLVQEVATDDEHVVDSTPQQIRLEAGQTETAQLVFFNSLKPGIHLIKVDSVTMKSLPNVRFEFVLVGGSYRQEFVTDINGEIDLSRLEPGAYQVRELEAPEGYLIDDAVRVVQINPDENANFVYTNTPKPSLRLIKTSSDGSRLAGVQFRIARIEDGTHYLDRITDTNGEINISGLEPGVYSVQETATVSDHVLDTKEYHVELFSGQTSTLTIENQKRPSLTIRKTDKDTGGPVPGVTFTLRGADGPTITTEPTGADGTVRITNLLPGTYTISEQSVPENYILDDATQTVTLFANREAQVEFQNYKRPTLKITKVDVKGKPLTGAIFTVTTKAGVKIGDFPVGADGTITVSNVHLNEGYYIVQEKQAPAGYILDPTPYEVYLRPGKTTELSIENEKKPGLTIYKVDSVVGDGIKGAKFEIWVSKDKDQNGTYRKLDSNYYYSDENGVIHLDNLDTGWYRIIEVEPPAGYMLKEPSQQTVYVEHDASVEVTIENIPKSALAICKTDAVTGAPLANAWFRVRYLGGTSGSGGTVIGEYQTSANGNIILTGLDAGTYIAEEISAPNGYVMDTSPQTAYISGKEQDCITLMFTNSKNGALLIKKVDSITGEPLSDVQFFVTDSDGKTLGNANGYFTTDSAGTILIPDITPGTTLVVKETRAKPGYVLDETAQTVRIKSGETATLEFRNQPTSSLLIRKACAVNPSVTLANAEFKVTYSDGAVVGDSNGIYRSNENGEVLIAGLIPGKSVVITETKAPTGFLIDTQPQTVVIQAGKTVSVTMKNQPMGQLIIQKRDSLTGQPLPGAEFRITTAAGCEVGLDGVIGTSILTSNGIFTTDAQGEIRITNLAPGAYVLTEIKAPAGYVIDTPSTNVVIGQGGDTQVVVVTNAPKGNLVVEKYDSVTKQPLAGAQFKITTASGELVAGNEGLTASNGLYSTDANGQIILSKLLPNTYFVTEVKAPDNYRADPAPQTVVVNAGETQTIRFYDDPLCTLTILKRDAVTQKPLKDAEFTVKDSEGRNIGRYATGADGTVIVSGLTPDAIYVVSEVKAPTGYIRDETPKNIVVRSGVSNSLTFDDEPTTTLIIRKFIEGTENEPLSGVAFKVVDGSGAAVGPDDGCYYTDKAGEIVLNDIEPGTTVIVREIKTVEGYVLDGTPQDIKIEAGRVQQLTFWNAKAGTLVVQKKDSVTGALIPGAQFQLTYANGGFVDNANGHLSSNGLYTTDANGEIRISGIIGAVVAKEVKAAPGYVIDSATQTQTVTVNPMDTQTLVFLNEPLCRLTITKLDSVTGKPVPGTVFSVKDGNGNLLGSYTTGADGTVTVTGLVPGSTVVVTETKVPVGYVLDPTPQTLIVKNGADNSVISGPGSSGTGTGNGLTFENDPTMTLTIHKYIEGTANEPLAGVAFKVTDSTGAAVGPGDGVFHTDAAGEIVIEGLEPGTVITAREIKTVDGFVLDGTPKTVKITAGTKAPELTFWNQRAGELVIRKLDSVTKKPLAGVEFQLTYASGGYVDAANGHLSSNGLYTTDSRGEIHISGVTGTIVARETRTISGYTIDETTRTQTVTVNPEDTQILTFYNTPQQTLIIQKYVDGTTNPIRGVTFLVTDSSGQVVGPNNGEYVTDRNGRIVITGLTPGTTITARETKTVSGYVLDATPQSILIKSGTAQALTFFNKAEGGLELIKVNEADRTQRIPGVVFEIRRMDGGLVDTVTTDKNGRVYVSLDAGDYYAVEVQAADGFKLDSAPHYFTVKDGKTTTLTIANKPYSSILIHKTDSATGRGIPSVTFLVYDSKLNPIGQITTDQSGFAYLDELDFSGRLYLRELDNPGYVVDTQLKTVYVKAGETTLIEWQNTPITGQIQIFKTSADYNPINGWAAGSPIPGTVFEIYDQAGNLVDTVQTDKNGVAASKPLLLGRYQVVESQSADFYLLDKTPITAEIEFAGQIVRVAMTNRSVSTGVSIEKRGYGEVMPGQNLRYTFSSIANESNVPLSSFYWRDTLPVNAVRLAKITTGTYSAAGSYKIVFRTNLSGEEYRILADNLSTQQNYVLEASPAALGLAANEYVTEVMFVFGVVPAGFHQVEAPMIDCTVLPGLANGLQFVNQADVGGVYGGQWVQAVSRWTTKVYAPTKPQTLPRTGY